MEQIMDQIDIGKIEQLLMKIGDYQKKGFANLDHSKIKIKDEKGRQSFLTEFDTISEKMINEFVSKHYPDHSLLGEESGNTVRNPEIYWIVDPIDGTTNFTIGYPFWGISIGIWMNKDLRDGFITFRGLN